MKLTPQEKTELKFILISFAEVMVALSITLLSTYLIVTIWKQ